MTIPLTLLPDSTGTRVSRDRLEMLVALMGAPNFDSRFAADVISIAPNDSVYRWGCLVDGCARVRRIGNRLCSAHYLQWNSADFADKPLAIYLEWAQPLDVRYGLSRGVCEVCKVRPSHNKSTKLCKSHFESWRVLALKCPETNYSTWVLTQDPLPGWGKCHCAVCPELAMSSVGLCEVHLLRYRKEGQPGGIRCPGNRRRGEFHRTGKQPHAEFDDEAVYRSWCAKQPPAYRLGVVNLTGLAPLAKAEIKWGLFAHGQYPGHSDWDLQAVQRLANLCRREGYPSLGALKAADFAGHDDADPRHSLIANICGEMLDGLNLIYYSPADTKSEGFIETDHFGRRFPSCRSKFDLTIIPQRWLRDLLWEHMADLLRSSDCPRTRGKFDALRRSCCELGAFLEIDAPDGGHVTSSLSEENALRFVADQRHRERHGMVSIGEYRRDRKPAVVTTSTRRITFNTLRKLLFWSLESGHAAELGVDRAFVVAFPPAGHDPKKSRSPFSDDVARALADEQNLRALEKYDPYDRGIRDVWELIVATGRRCSEILNLRFDCVGRYGGLPMLWHDQTKVGKLDQAIRIPERMYIRIQERQQKTAVRFEARHGREPTPSETAAIALFPSDWRNPNELRPISYGFFSKSFRDWVRELALPTSVAHQARHTLATNLLKAGASLSHIRRYLGQVSDRMAEQYVQVAHSDLEDVLNTVWVAGPGAPHPGELIAGGEPLTREQALALAIDLSRRSTPADGGFCTFQPVVDGGACPWNLDCENCDKFVLSGADLLYWRRKQGQWRSIAERAPDDATADYLHQVFEPTANAIAGLERALAGLGLLEEALQVDLRRPQDYFQRVWSTNFRAADLANLNSGVDGDSGDGAEQETA